MVASDSGQLVGIFDDAPKSVRVVGSSRRSLIPEDRGRHVQRGYRIRGAILNGLEHATEQAAQHARRKQIEKERVESVIGGARGASEALEELVEVTVGLALGFALEDSGLSAEPETFDPYRVLELKRLRERLLLIVEALPEREKQIVKWHYFEHMDFKLIGLAFRLSKGRISQLHARALKLIREGLRSIDRFDLSL